MTAEILLACSVRAPRGAVKGGRIVPALLGVLLAVAGCASTRIVNEWVSPQYAAHRFERILVIGVSKQAGVRRSFEDALVARLREEGVEAEPSYRWIPKDGPVDEAQLRDAVAQSKADGVLMTRLVRREVRTEVTPGTYQPAVPIAGIGLYPWYTGAWVGYYEPPRIYQHEVRVAETSLYDAVGNQLVWTATAETVPTGSLVKDIAGYVSKMVKALKKDHLLAAAPVP